MRIDSRACSLAVRNNNKWLSARACDNIWHNEFVHMMVSLEKINQSSS